MFGWAARQRLIPTDPTVGRTEQVRVTPKAEFAVLSASEVLAVAAPSATGDGAVAVAAAPRCCVGAVRPLLRWRDVDFAGGASVQRRRRRRPRTPPRRNRRRRGGAGCVPIARASSQGSSGSVAARSTPRPDDRVGRRNRRLRRQPVSRTGSTGRWRPPRYRPQPDDGRTRSASTNPPTARVRDDLRPGVPGARPSRRGWGTPTFLTKMGYVHTSRRGRGREAVDADRRRGNHRRRGLGNPPARVGEPGDVAASVAALEVHAPRRRIAGERRRG